MINVIGLGYIGLPTALMLASNGLSVIGTDFNDMLVRTLKTGQVSFEEEGLKDLLKSALAGGILFSTEYAVTDQYIVAVQTPYDKKSKKIDPAYVVSAVEKIVEVCLPNTTLIIESTVSPGTIDKFVRPVIKNSGKLVQLVHAPERIIPGRMLYELRRNARTIGADDRSTAERVVAIYQSFCSGEFAVTDIRTAEMTKVIENTFRDVNIAFANELAKICRAADMDVYEVIKIANKHPRVNILQPGPGVGGHCISVDPWFLVGDYPDIAQLITTARKTNDAMPEYVLSRIVGIMKENGITDFSKVGLYGLTYKENVDDTRESPSLQLLEKMQEKYRIQCKTYDPHVKKDVSKNQIHDLFQFLEGVELVVVMVAHDELKKDIEQIQKKIIYDTRNILPPNQAYKL